jgi:hypothetical protein
VSSIIDQFNNQSHHLGRTFAIMALLTAVLGGGAPDMLCSAVHHASPLGENGPDVLTDERLPFAALAEARLQATQRYPPVLIRRLPDRVVPNLACSVTDSLATPHRAAKLVSRVRGRAFMSAKV